MERYAVIDVETTGLSPQKERLTEIAIVVVSDGEVIDQWSSLINPERKIPYRITQLTGINNQMVEAAPKFYEVAKKVVELTQDCTFVAHNASFDYRFIQAEFARYSYDFQSKVLDTVKLSRKLLPGSRSYSLGKLCDQLGIRIENRHRALGDALATVELLKILLSKDANLAQLNLRGLHSQLNSKMLDALPQETGVYYFFNDKDDLIYIGKSKNIHSRIISHLNNTTTRKAMEMREQIAKVDFELCGSELVALLLESDEIKKHMPIYNRAQRRTSYLWGIYDEIDSNGYQCFSIARISDKPEVSSLTVFASKKAALSELERLTEEYQLCQKLNGLYQSEGSCFHYGLQQCFGACIGKESANDYNERANRIIDRYQYEGKNMLIIDKGRKADERVVVLIENNVYQGFGFVALDELSQPVEMIKSFVKHYADNRDVASIIRSYLKRNKVEAIIPF